MDLNHHLSKDIEGLEILGHRLGLLDVNTLDRESLQKLDLAAKKLIEKLSETMKDLDQEKKQLTLKKMSKVVTPFL